jgi:hypothetical protein
MESMIEALAEYFELTHGLSDEAGIDQR